MLSLLLACLCIHNRHRSPRVVLLCSVRVQLLEYWGTNEGLVPWEFNAAEAKRLLGQWCSACALLSSALRLMHLCVLFVCVCVVRALVYPPALRVEFQQIDIDLLPL
jgi:hypothetical protein